MTDTLDKFIDDLRGTLWMSSESDLDKVETRLRRIVGDPGPVCDVCGLGYPEHRSIFHEVLA